MQPLLNINFWFNLRPGPLQALFLKIFLIFLIILLLLSIFSGIRQMKKGLYRPIWKRVYNFSLSNLIIGLILLFFNYESAVFLSARFWLAFWFIIILIWIFYIIKDFHKILIRQKNLSKEKEYKKYLP